MESQIKQTDFIRACPINGMGSYLQSLFSPNDEQAMWRVKTQDDPQAFARLVARWERPIQRLCARMTGDRHRAEDLTQEVFARVFARRASWEPAGRFSTFLWRIALNLCHDEARRRRRRGECSLDAMGHGDGEELDCATEEPGPDDQADASERGELVRRAMLNLPAIHREVVVLRHYEGLKFHEIADVLGIPEGTAKSRMADALTRLGRMLNRLSEENLCNPKIQKCPIPVT